MVQVAPKEGCFVVIVANRMMMMIQKFHARLPFRSLARHTARIFFLFCILLYLDWLFLWLRALIRLLL